MTAVDATRQCALVAYLRSAQPERMPLRGCCVAGLLDRHGRRRGATTPDCLAPAATAPVAAETS